MARAFAWLYSSIWDDQDFLEHLKIPKAEIEQIRERARGKP